MSDNLNTYWAQIIVEELVRSGVEYFCICPGSRSTPLATAVGRNDKGRGILCYDERGAGFHALGYARGRNVPAAVVTTSGTASANLLPSVVEAATDRVPLILLTADRPPELSDTGANQTLNQAGLFGHHVRWEFDLPCPGLDVPVEAVLTTIDQAVNRAMTSPCGPVHINCRYREPLEPSGSAAGVAVRRGWAEREEPLTRYRRPQLQPDRRTIEDLVERVSATSRGLILAGRLRSERERQGIMSIAEKLGWPVYADVTSGLRLGEVGTNVIRHFDQELLSRDFNEKARPEVVLHFGGRTTSKRIGLFFAENMPDSYIVIKDDPTRYDPIHAVTEHIQADIALLCDALQAKLDEHGQNAYRDFYSRKARKAIEIIERSISSESMLTEAFVARELSGSIPEGSGLFLSSSMPIRDMDLYSRSGRKDIQVGANRGISGIDGVIASAAGFARGIDGMVTLVIGDVAFIHDVNSLSMLGRIDRPVITVLINNNGGGIFDFLGISKFTDVFEDYFAAPHGFSFEGVCETFKVDHYTASAKKGFADTYRSAIEKGVSAVIEVVTDRQTNLRLRKGIKKAIIEALES